jgi:hypothetical protein
MLDLLEETKTLGQFLERLERVPSFEDEVNFFLLRQAIAKIESDRYADVSLGVFELLFETPQWPENLHGEHVFVALKCIELSLYMQKKPSSVMNSS